VKTTPKRFRLGELLAWTNMGCAPRLKAQWLEIDIIVTFSLGHAMDKPYRVTFSLRDTMDHPLSNHLSEKHHGPPME